jgi:hypothetical protein
MRKLIGSSSNSELTPAVRTAMHRIVVDGSLAFWDATLRGNAGALHWLEAGGFTHELGDLGKFEQKHPSTTK